MASLHSRESWLHLAFLFPATASLLGLVAKAQRRSEFIAFCSVGAKERNLNPADFRHQRANLSPLFPTT